MRSLQSSLVLFLLTFALCLGLVAIPSACNGNQRSRTLHAALIATNVARDGFVAWDAAHQAQLVESATSRAEAEAALAAYRGRRDKLISDFERVYRAIATAATQTDRPSLVEAEELGRRLLATIDSIKGEP